MAYSESPERNSVREMATSARPRAGRLAVPMKMTSSIFALRSALVLWAPKTQVTASTTLDLPEPFGPTTAVTPVSNSSTVLSCLLYTSDAADDLLCVALGGRRIIKKQKK